ncbi:MAG: BACON domain-containing protein [Alistipes sp.]|nr:BACON domain-containing protein [Alistipes sp.]
MQKFLAFTTLLISLLVVSCEVEHIRPTQAISITSSTSVEVGRYAGEFVVSYTADSTPEISLSSEWLRIMSNDSGKATILYDTNDTGGIRQAAVVFSHEASKATVVVTQSNENLTPTISLIDESVIELDRCGQLVEIGYTIQNTNPEDYVYAKTSAEWIYSIDCKTSSNKIALGVATNTSGKERSTTITIGYGSATVDGDTPNTRIFAKEFTFISDTPGTSNIAMAWTTHYNLAEVAAVDAEH